MEAKQILDSVRAAKDDFGLKCGKYAGAVTVEAIREVIRDAGHNVSPRDCFIRGVPIEVDLLLAADGVEPQLGCLYEPSDVLVAVEIKNCGSFGNSTIKTTRANFDKIIATAAGVRCCYVTLAERERFKDAVTTENLGYQAFTLFWHTGSKPIKYTETGDWQKFLAWLGEKKG